MSVVPSPGVATPSRNATKRASSASADAPFSGSRPACAARPRKRTSKTPQPLRATFAAPSSDGSSTSTWRWRRATLTVSSRDAAGADLLVGHEQQRHRSRRAIARHRRQHRHADRDTRLHVEDARPRGARRPRAATAVCASVPAGQTVSRWPSSSVPPSRGRDRGENARPRVADTGAAPPARRARGACREPRRRAPRRARRRRSGSRAHERSRDRRRSAAGPTRRPRASAATWATILAARRWRCP